MMLPQQCRRSARTVACADLPPHAYLGTLCRTLLVSILMGGKSDNAASVTRSYEENTESDVGSIPSIRENGNTISVLEPTFYYTVHFPNQPSVTNLVTNKLFIYCNN